MKYSDEFHFRWFQIENIILSILKPFIKGAHVDFRPHLKLRTFEHMKLGPIRLMIQCQITLRPLVAVMS